MMTYNTLVFICQIVVVALLIASVFVNNKTKGAPVGATLTLIAGAICFVAALLCSTGENIGGAVLNSALAVALINLTFYIKIRLVLHNIENKSNKESDHE
jgi:uncharacterized membrane-anchored protein YitT (DUF2179 family)